MNTISHIIIIVTNFQILVSVLNPLSPKKTPVEEPVEDQTQPTITLEVSIDWISDRSRMGSWNGFRTDLGSEQLDSVTVRPCVKFYHHRHHCHHHFHPHCYQVPGFTYPTGCLSPIMEMQTPLATPCPSPLPTPLLTRCGKNNDWEDDYDDDESEMQTPLPTTSLTIPVVRCDGREA